MKHLAIFKKDGAEEILKGKNSIESRFSKSKIPPFKVVSSGDLVYIKASGGDIIGQFRVKKVIFFDNFDLNELKEKFGVQLELDDLKGKEDCKYASLIFIGNSSRFITSPIRIKKSDLRGWVVLH